MLLGEVRKFIGEVLKISGEAQSQPRGGAHLPAPPPKIRPCILDDLKCLL